MGVGLDVRVDAHRNARLAPDGGGDGGNPVDLAERLGVDGASAERDRAFDLRARLAHARDDNLVGRESGAQRHLELASGVDVSRRTETTQVFDERERGVRLERVVQAMRHGRQRPLQRHEALGQQAGAVDVTRGPDLAGNGGQRDVVAQQPLTRTCESSHRIADCIAAPGQPRLL